MTTQKTPKTPKVTKIPQVNPPNPVEPQDYPDTEANRKFAEAVQRVLKCPVAPSHWDLANYSILDCLTNIQILSADLQATANIDLRLRIARELASLHKALQAWSVDPSTQTKGAK